MDVQILLIIYATQHVLEMASCMILLTNLFYLYLKKLFRLVNYFKYFQVIWIMLCATRTIWEKAVI